MCVSVLAPEGRASARAQGSDERGGVVVGTVRYYLAVLERPFHCPVLLEGAPGRFGPRTEIAQGHHLVSLRDVRARLERLELHRPAQLLEERGYLLPGVAGLGPGDDRRRSGVHPLELIGQRAEDERHIAFAKRGIDRLDRAGVLGLTHLAAPIVASGRPNCRARRS